MKINPTPVDILHPGDIFSFCREEQLIDDSLSIFYCVEGIDLFNNIISLTFISLRKSFTLKEQIDSTFFRKTFVLTYSLSDILEFEVYKIEPND